MAWEKGSKPLKGWQDWQPHEFKPTHCTQLIEVMSTAKGVHAFNAANNISRGTFYRWLDQYPDFKMAHEIGKERSKAYLLSLLHENVYEINDPTAPTEKLNMAVWNAIMKHQHQIPEGREAQSVLCEASKGHKSMMTSVLEGLRSGVIDLEEAEQMAKIIETAQKVGDTAEMMVRIEQLEKMLEAGVKADDFKEE